MKINWIRSRREKLENSQLYLKALEKAIKWVIGQHSCQWILQTLTISVNPIEYDRGNWEWPIGNKN